MRQRLHLPGSMMLLVMLQHLETAFAAPTCTVHADCACPLHGGMLVIPSEQAGDSPDACIHVHH